MNMIVLTIDTSGLKDYKNDQSIIQADAAVLGVTGFELPVMLLVNNTNLFEITPKKDIVVNSMGNQSIESISTGANSSWLTLPVLNFALNGLEVVKKVYQGESIEFILPEVGSRLRFRSIDNMVEIYSGINKKTAITDSQELLQAFEDFLAEVKRALRDEVPQLLEHPYWGPWLKEE
jgi:hypothetical protein